MRREGSIKSRIDGSKGGGNMGVLGTGSGFGGEDRFERGIRRGRFKGLEAVPPSSRSGKENVVVVDEGII